MQIQKANSNFTQFYLFTDLVEAIKVWKGGPDAVMQLTEKIYQKFFIKDDNKIKF